MVSLFKEECEIRRKIKTVMFVPTRCGIMAKVDSKGRIVLPQEVRERLDITSGTEVEIREEDGKAVVEPEKEPDEIIARMNELIGEKRDVEEGPPSTTEHTETRPLSDHPDSIAQEFRETVEKGAEQASDE